MVNEKRMQERKVVFSKYSEIVLLTERANTRNNFLVLVKLIIVWVKETTKPQIYHIFKKGEELERISIFRPGLLERGRGDICHGGSAGFP